MFNNINSIEELKKEYKRLALQLHPDMGGDAEEFKKMQNEYERLFEVLKNKDTKKTEETTETPEEFKNLIDKLIFFEGVKIEIIGTWIWLSGNTYVYKDKIKELNFQYSKNKKSWYFNGNNNNIKRRGHFTIEELRNRFETSEIETNKKIYIA